MTNERPPYGDDLSDGDAYDIEAVIAEYLERLNSGEAIDPKTILAEHPGIGHEVLRTIQEFVDLGQDLELGTIGDYTLRRRIGRGGMGVVYEAWQNSMDRRVAVKVLPVGVAADDKTFQRFMREARTAGKLNHPNVVPVYAMGVDENTPYYAMECVEGETLSQVLNRLRAGRESGSARQVVDEITRVLRADPDAIESAPEDAAVDKERKFSTQPSLAFGSDDLDLRYYAHLAHAFAGVADGLHHAHSRGVIHRDIKPSNLILDRRTGPTGACEGRLRILDFGLARLEGQASLTMSGDFLGTVLYMSPEQAMAKRIRVDQRTDIYSLGATMYEMLTWEPPFQGKHHQDTLSQIIFRDPRPPRQLNPRIPRNLETIVLKCLRKDPASRYGTAEALAQDLRRFVRGDPIEARPQAVWEHTLRRLRRHWVAWSLVASLVAVAALLSIVLVMRSQAAHQLRVARYENDIRDASARIQLHALTVSAGQGDAPALDPQEEFRFFGLSQQLGEGGQAALEGILTELTKWAREVPDRPEAHFLKARTLVLLGRPEEALGALDRALDRDSSFGLAVVFRADLMGERSTLDPGTPGWVDSFAKARRAVAQRDWMAAEAAYSELLALQPGGEEVYLGAVIEARLGRGYARMKSGDFWGSVEDLAHAKERWPTLIEPAYLLAKAYRQNGENEQADKTLRALYDRAPDKILAAGWIALFYEGFDDYPAGLEWAQKLPDRFMEFVFYLRLERHEDLLRVVRVMRQENPARPEVDLYEATAHSVAAQAQGATREGWAHLTAALEKATRFHQVMPDNFIGSVVLAELRLLQGRWDDADQILLELESRAPDDPVWRRHIAYQFFKHRLWQQALKHNEALLAVRTPQPEWASSAALMLRHLRRWDEAVRWLTLAVELDDSPTVYDFALATSYASLGRTEDAVASIIRALDQHPYSGVNHEFLAAFLGGPDYNGRSSALEAKLAELERDLDPSTMPIQAFRCLAHWRLYSPTRHHLDTALEHARAAVERSRRGDADALATLARVHFARGDRREAVKTLEEAFLLPGGRLAAEALLQEYRDALRPDLVSLESAEAAVESASDPEAIEALLDMFRKLRRNPVGTDRAVAAYLEARILELQGESDTAATIYRRLLSDDGGNPERIVPYLAECLRRAGQPAEAAEDALQYLRKYPAQDRSLRNLWLGIQLADLDVQPNMLLARLPDVFPSDAQGPPDVGADLDDARWLLAELAAGRPLRIACGAPHNPGADCPGWSRDRFFLRGEVNNPPFYEIAGTDQPALYRRHRWFSSADRPGGYEIPLPRGRYEVRLHFAEVWVREPERRVFDIRIEGKTVQESFEPGRAGFAVAQVLPFVVEITDGLLTLELQPRSENPAICGIEVAPYSLDDAGVGPEAGP